MSQEFNVIEAKFSSRDRKCVIGPLWQYDYGQILRITGIDLPESYEVHFSNDPRGVAKSIPGNANGVRIPAEYLKSGSSVFAWLYVHQGEDDGSTEYQIEITVRRRARPTSEAPDSEEKTAIGDLIERMNVALSGAKEERAKAEQAANTAEQKVEEVDTSVKLAQSYAIGGTGVREDEDQNNAKFWYERTAAAHDENIVDMELKKDELIAQLENDAQEKAGIVEQAAEERVGLILQKVSESETHEVNSRASEFNAAASETKAAQSATKAGTSESNAKTSEENAAGSEKRAKTSEENAKQSETAAGQSEQNAKDSETAAKLSEQNAYQNATDSVKEAKKAVDAAAEAAKSAEEARQAANEAGGVKTINGQTPDENGNVDVRGINVTAQPGQLIRVKEVDADGKPTAWEPVPWGYTEGGMVEILPETTLTSHSGNPKTFNTPWGITSGKTYVVTFDGKEYKCEAFAYTYPGSPFTMTLLGDYSRGLDVPATGEPFGIMEMDAETAAALDMPGMLVTVYQNVSRETCDFSISISEVAETVHPIPGKLLPEGVPYVEQGELVEILPETTLTEDAEDPGTFGIDENAPVLEIGKTYIVNLNGTEYTCVGQDMSAMVPGAVLLGNLGAVDGTIGTGEPFVMVSALDGETQVAIVLSLGDINELTLSIKEMTGTVHKLDNRCLDLAWLPTMTVGMGEVQAETALNQSLTDIDTYYFESTCSFEVGKNYTIIIGDVEYNAIAFDGAIIGLEIGTFLTDNIKNISFVCTPGEFVSYTSSVSPGGSTTIKILGETEIHNKLPKEFLPDDVGGGGDILRVNLDVSSMTATKTGAEICQAVQEGKTVHLYAGDSFSPCINCISDYGAAFFQMIGVGSINENGNVSINSIGETQTICVKPDGSVLIKMK